MNRLATLRSLVFVGVSALATMAMSAGAQPAAKEPHWVDQGVAWTKNARDDFYSRNQGSHLMRLSWLQALKQPDGSAFAADGLARYGYLPNPASSVGLPVGFTVTSGSAPQVGMTCAACHTRQIEVGGEAYRVDGGPALVDFQALLRDLDAAVAATLATPAAFDDFASRALPGAATNVEKAQLLSDLSDWQARSHALLSLSLPVASPWGVGRADAVQMIFNRLTGLDIGATQSRVVEHSSCGYSGSLSVFVERRLGGQNPMDGFCTQWQRRRRHAAQHGTGYRSVRRVSPREDVERCELLARRP
jgi:hypothetical protein